MNCLIVDDEPLVRIGMECLTGQYNQLKLLGSSRNTASITDFLKKNEVYLLFLDIEMPEVNGPGFARTLPGWTLVIFTTVYSQYALDSYETDVLDYLIKSITPGRLKEAVTKAESYHQLLTQQKTDFESTDTQYINIRANRRDCRITYSDILYIEALKDYVIIHAFTGKYVTWISLKSVHSQLPSALFVRTSKSYVVNAQHISSYTH